jgi:hypothetical protein
MLHITNGDAAVGALQGGGIAGDFLPWRDVLHEGPVPEGLPPAALDRVRADFLAALGWGEARALAEDFSLRRKTLESPPGGAVTLWFEHDLYDQLQCLQVLAELPEGVPIGAVITDDFLTSMEPRELLQMSRKPPAVTAAERARGAAAWAAFRSPDPAAWEGVGEGEGEGSPLRHLAAAFRRLREELPGERDGLSRTERQILETVAELPEITAAAAFRECNRREEAAFLGDLGFALHLHRLTAVPAPLLAAADDDIPWEVPRPPAPPGTRAGNAFWRTPLALTPEGYRCLQGQWHPHRDNCVTGVTGVAGGGRWLGGVRL